MRTGGVHCEEWRGARVGTWVGRRKGGGRQDLMALVWRHRETGAGDVRPRTEEKAGVWGRKTRKPQIVQCGENWPTREGKKNRKEGADPEIPRLNPSPAHATSHAYPHLRKEESANFRTTKGHVYVLAGAAAERGAMPERTCGNTLQFEPSRPIALKDPSLWPFRMSSWGRIRSRGNALPVYLAFILVSCRFC